MNFIKKSSYENSNQLESRQKEYYGGKSQQSEKPKDFYDYYKEKLAQLNSTNSYENKSFNRNTSVERKKVDGGNADVVRGGCQLTNCFLCSALGNNNNNNTLGGDYNSKESRYNKQNKYRSTNNENSDNENNDKKLSIKKELREIKNMRSQLDERYNKLKKLIENDKQADMSVDECNGCSQNSDLRNPYGNKYGGYDKNNNDSYDNYNNDGNNNRNDLLSRFEQIKRDINNKMKDNTDLKKKNNSSNFNRRNSYDT